MMPAFDYVRVKSLDQALKELASGGARLHAGGTDLLGCLRDGVFTARKLVSIQAIEELRGVRETPEGLRIGALATIREVAESPVIGKFYPGLCRAAAEVGSPQLRNQGTIGGNLCQKPRCWYYRGEFHCLRKGGDLCFAVGGENSFHAILGGDRCYYVHPSDTAPMLLALDAGVTIAGPKGVKTIPLSQFYVSPGKDVERETILGADEIVTQILLPGPGANLRTSYRKVRARRSWDFALAGVALALRFDGARVADCRVVLAGAAPFPWRSREVEEVIRGRKPEASIIAEARKAVVKDAQALEHNAYKINLIQAVLEEEMEGAFRS
jgi:xanthine dehydrogenase YagS FAD-binding subunit